MLLAQRSSFVMQAPFKMVDLVANSQIQERILEFEEHVNPGHLVNFYQNGQLYAFVSCRSDWFRYDDQHGWINEYQLDNHGYTCNAQVFLEGGNPHLIGGYGIWRGQALNIKFENSEWHSITGKNVPENYNPSLGFIYQDSSYLLIGGSYENSFQGIDEDTKDCFIVSNKGEWSKIKVSPDLGALKLDRDYLRLLTEKYIIAFARGNGKPHIVLQNINSEKIYFVELDFSPFGKDALWIDGDTLRIATQAGVLYTLSVPELMSNGIPVQIVSDRMYQKGLLLFVLIALVLVGIVNYIKKSHKGSQIITTPSFYDKVLEFANQTLSVEEIDSIFENTNLGYDATRKRRSELIKSINEYQNKMFGNDLVIREKDKNDKRRMLYKIDTGSK